MARVSVIMPAYNGVQTIQKAIASLQAQTFSDIEIIVVDDRSTDGTYELLQELAREDPRIKLDRMPHNTGPAAARQVALEKASGEWVTLCDADDRYEPDRIEMLLQAATAHKPDMVLDNLIIFDHSLNKIVRHTNFKSSNRVSELTAEDVFKLDNPLRPDSIGYSKPFIRTGFMRAQKISYRDKYRTNEDFILLAETVLKGAKTLVLPEAYYVYCHRISPTTRKVSPTSRSADDSALVVAQASDELLAKYHDVMTDKARQQLLRRKKIFLTAKIAGEQTFLFNNGQYSKGLALFFTHPALWGYRATGVRNRVLSKLRRPI